MSKDKEVNILGAKRGLFELRLHEIWKFRDLIMMFVKRDFVAFYKQTILGPIWFFLQPLFSSFIFMIVFTVLVRVDTDGVPPILFYLCGTIFWGYFAETFKKISSTFLDNAGLFGKVYFPRLTVPISLMLTNLIRLALQMLLFFVAYFFVVDASSEVSIALASLWIIPVCLIILMSYAFGGGILISALTTKYRDLRFLFEFALQLFMYVTPILYPISFVGEKGSMLFYNPLTFVFEALRCSLFGINQIDYFNLFVFSGGVGLLILFIGLLTFNKVDKNFMDTI